MRPATLALAAALLLAMTACGAAGSGGNGAPKASPANPSTAPSYVPTPSGGTGSDPYDYGY
jgi:hypothetical protein